MIAKAIKNTFLQHNQFFTSAGDATEYLTIDNLKVAISYKKAKFYAHQEFAEKLCDENNRLSKEKIGIKGWLYPGTAIKHYAFKTETQFTETIERTLALVFAPVACFYFITPKSYLHDTKSQYSLVVPDVTDLELYARQRQKLNRWNIEQLYTSGSSDASFRILTQQATFSRWTSAIAMLRALTFSIVYQY